MGGGKPASRGQGSEQVTAMRRKDARAVTRLPGSTLLQLKSQESFGRVSHTSHLELQRRTLAQRRGRAVGREGIFPETTVGLWEWDQGPQRPHEHGILHSGFKGPRQGGEKQTCFVESLLEGSKHSDMKNIPQTSTTIHTTEAIDILFLDVGLP